MYYQFIKVGNPWKPLNGKEREGGGVTPFRGVSDEQLNATPTPKL